MAISIGRRVAVSLVTAWLVVACNSVASAPPTSSPVPAATPPPGWKEVAWADPDTFLSLPTEWTSTSPRETVLYDAASIEPAQRRVMDWSNVMAASGATRLVAYATDATGNECCSIQVYVQSGDGSLAAFVERWIKETHDLLGPSIAIDQRAAHLTVGDAARLAYAYALGREAELAEIDVLYRTTDGRSVAISVEGQYETGDVAALGPFADRIVSTVRPSP